MRLIKVENITEDQQLARPIFHKGNILLNKGVHGLDRYQQRLQDLGIRHIYVEDELSQGIQVNDVVKKETRQRGREIIQNTFEQISFNQDINIKEVKNLVGDIVDELFYRDEILVNMVDIKSFNSYTFAHSVNVAVLSIILAKSLNYDKNRMRKLGIGAILHDIGKVLIPEDVIKKPGKLTEEEYNLVKKHPELGYRRVKDNLEISPLSRTVILKHHERVDGSGYPEGETGDKTHEFARIAGIADVFDALNSDRIYRDRWPINKIINYLMSNPGKFDQNLVRNFIRNIAVYPNGTRVVLSNGSKAIVRAQNKNYPTRPIIDIIESGDGQKVSRTVDLLESLNLVIEDID